MKDGKKSISEKRPYKLLTADEVFGQTLSLPPEVKADMEKRGLVPRWLNSKLVHDNQGYHPRGWKVYTRPKGVESGLSFGSDASGTIRRGNDILGYKEKDLHTKHKDFLQQRADQAIGAIDGSAQELREHARKSGLKTQVVDDEDDEA